MDALQVESTLSRIAEDLRDNRDAGCGEIMQLGKGAIALVNDVCTEATLRLRRREAQLLALFEKLDLEDTRTKKLEERISQASNAAVEAELWMTRLSDAMKTKLLSRDGPSQRALQAA
jgi:hypothetical protein